MGEWEELTKENVPQNLSTIEYEWEWYKPQERGWCKCGWSSAIIFLNLWRGRLSLNVRFREIEPIEDNPRRKLAQEYKKEMQRAVENYENTAYSQKTISVAVAFLLNIASEENQ